MAILEVPGTYPTIQAAVDAATPGDRIRVAASYAGNEGVIVTVNNLFFSAPAGVTGIVLNVSPGIKKVSTVGYSPIQIVGNGEDNELVGNSGANLFLPGSGTDTLAGGRGDDTFLINGGGGTANGGRGNDTVLSNDLGGYAFTGMETLDTDGGTYIYGSVAQLASFSTITDSVGAADSQITLYVGGAGGTVNLAPRIAGAHSVQVFAGGATSGVIIAGSVNGDSLAGSGFDDRLSGGDGNDLIIGSLGTDVLNGGAGDDTFRIEYGGDGTLSGGKGSDTVQSNDLGTFSLSAVETLDKVGFDQIYATAAQLSAFDTITDSVAAPDSQIVLFLSGAGGIIRLVSRVAGAHSVYVADSGLTGELSVVGTINGDFMVASANLNKLRGDDGDDIFEVYYGGNGAVNGGVNGGDGSDTVRSNDLGTFDLLHVETLDTFGFNQVYATAAQLASFSTITDSEAAADSRIVVFLQGAGGSVNLRSRVAGAHSVYVADSGLTGAVKLTGTVNDDVMIASTNINRLRGEGGDDTFQVYYGGTGTVNGGAGTDTVQSNDLGSFNLSQVEILDTNGFNEVRATARQLSLFDTITESVLAPNSQITVFLQDGPGAIDFSTRVAGAHSVQVFATGLSTGIKITGSVNGDALIGSSYADILAGGGGLDTLTGGTGNDIFLFDQALVAGNVATIVDFSSGNDRLWLSTSIFAAAGPAGALNANAFFAGAGALDADDRIGYDAGTGRLLYDADGTGAQAAQVFAVLAPGAPVTAADFRLV